ncbi:helix-turn-helix transcriptional regulator [Glycomyces buryatensis]|uniref:Helix-turn-helix transcriptional regulator n=2 Tax=Glycomyces buryatensis TaxID=2570927 RepID=A0A4S8Q7W8_9ACTN|nr:helix-turn-helix transcriptional regulator [Glycomyces buryatensis]
MCQCRSVLDLLANKWTALIIDALEVRTHRFGELRQRLKGISRKMLTQTLRALEADGLVNRKVYPEVPLRVEYSLTDLGRSAAIPLRQLKAWSRDNADEIARSRQAYDDSGSSGSHDGVITA